MICCGVPLTVGYEPGDWTRTTTVSCLRCLDERSIVGRGATEAEAREDYREQWTDRHGEEPEA